MTKLALLPSRDSNAKSPSTALDVVSPRGCLAVVDPMASVVNALVDDMCKLASDMSNAYRTLQTGDRKQAAKQLRQIVKEMGDAHGRSQIALWECSKPKSGAFARETNPKRPRPAAPIPRLKEMAGALGR